MKIKFVFSVITILAINHFTAQIINKGFNSSKPISSTSSFEIQAQENLTSILVDVIYNAIPDGYILTYTTTFLGKNISDVELRANKKLDDLIISIEPLNIKRKDVTIDLISLDPIFDFTKNDSMVPQSYRITQNISFNIKDINMIGKLSKKCLEYSIYDLINAQAYIIQTDAIQDSLDKKSIEILNQKKKLCQDAGIKFIHGNVQFSNYKEVYYPSEKYLKSFVNNATYFNHNSEQNSSITLQRKLDVDNYYDFNLKNADFVFNSNNNQPVIQFYTQLQYGFIKTDTEEEMRVKIIKEEEKKPVKEFYVIDKDGNLTKIVL